MTSSITNAQATLEHHPWDNTRGHTSSFGSLTHVNSSGVCRITSRPHPATGATRINVRTKKCSRLQRHRLPNGAVLMQLSAPWDINTNVSPVLKMPPPSTLTAAGPPSKKVSVYIQPPGSCSAQRQLKVFSKRRKDDPSLAYSIHGGNAQYYSLTLNI